MHAHIALLSPESMLLFAVDKIWAHDADLVSASSQTRCIRGCRWYSSAPPHHDPPAFVGLQPVRLDFFGNINNVLVQCRLQNNAAHPLAVVHAACRVSRVTKRCTHSCTTKYSVETTAVKGTICEWQRSLRRLSHRARPSTVRPTLPARPERLSFVKRALLCSAQCLPCVKLTCVSHTLCRL